MQNLMNDVAAFRLACDLPISAKPAIPPAGNLALHVSLINEEVNKELLPAMQTRDICDIAGEMADAIYVIIGAALEYGIPLDRVWQAKQAANMAKVDPVTGAVKKNAVGKVQKPDGWKPADISAVIFPKD